MIKRILIAIIIALLACGSLASCYAYEPETNVKAEVPEKIGIFILIEKGSIKNTDVYQYILYDPDTMVMYSYLDGYSGGGPTPLYNADGSPRLYSPNSETE